MDSRSPNATCIEGWHHYFSCFKPGSANLIGGRGVTLKNVWSRTVQGMKFPDAPYTLKMAWGKRTLRGSMEVEKASPQLGWEM
ncbi:MAG: hypothetical protein Ct9H300mP3_08350 [Gammaproteobacteria bacterium]|nr:MAG: hypothetical protein Ct9H300mP3_08350 [Gammaproteobacteria bacterium]